MNKLTLFFCILVASLLALCSPASARAGVDVTWTPASPQVEQAVTFTASITKGACGPKTPCQYEYLESGTVFRARSTSATATRTFSTAGTRPITVKLYNANAQYKGEVTKSLTVAGTTPPPPPPTDPTRIRFDTTEPSTPGFTNPNFPRTLRYCASAIVLNPWEPAHGNTGALNAGDSYATMGWGDGNAKFSWWSGFPRWLDRRAQIDGHYSNASTDHALTTTEAISFAACRWGIREDLIRAVAVQESDWHTATVGDQCGTSLPPSNGYGSYGITQVKNLNCANEGAWGGWPRTANSIPFNLDTYGAAFRACLEQAFWSTIPAGDDNARRERGCVGSWFTGSYAPDAAYTVSVYGHLAGRAWETY
jgi:hypothetical protein